MKTVNTKDRLKGRGRSLFPVKCDHCGKVVTKPHSFLSLVRVLATGRNGYAPAYKTVIEAAGDLELTRQAVYPMFRQALEAGVIEPVAKGSNTYRVTRHGIQMLSQWKSAGWR